MKLISYNNEAPTAWITLNILVNGFIILLMYTYTYANEIEYVLETPTIQKEAKAVQIITVEEHQAEIVKQEFLADLRFCESQNNDEAVGDGGASVGSYQWQKPTLEDKLGRPLSYSEYYSIVTDYETIHELTYKTYFEDGERWRWYNCTIKIKGTLAWEL